MNIGERFHIICIADCTNLAIQRIIIENSSLPLITCMHRKKCIQSSQTSNISDSILAIMDDILNASRIHVPGINTAVSERVSNASAVYGDNEFGNIPNAIREPRLTTFCMISRKFDVERWVESTIPPSSPLIFESQLPFLQPQPISQPQSRPLSH